jgi:hypothetical protein
LWSTSQAVFSQLSRASIAPPRSSERLLGSALDESSRVTSIPARHIPSTLMTAPASLASAVLPPQPAAPVRASRTWFLGTLLAAGAVLVVGLVVILATSSGGSLAPQQNTAAPDRSGRIEVRSTPEGAAVFIGGEPTGLSTPAVLRGLSHGRTLRLRVDKAGFASQERDVEVVAGREQTQLFELLPSDGRVRFIGAPEGARVYVDDAPITLDRDTPVNLSVGTHAVRVETPSALIFSGTVKVVPGEQTVHVSGDRAIP